MITPEEREAARNRLLARTPCTQGGNFHMFSNFGTELGTMVCSGCGAVSRFLPRDELESTTPPAPKLYVVPDEDE